jgi:hypothetical protein
LARKGQSRAFPDSYPKREEVRAQFQFLPHFWQRGAAIEPWSGLDAALYVLLDRRRNDPAPWLQL